MTHDICKHCGISLPGIGPWCERCRHMAAVNHGVCDFCKQDLTQFVDCWPAQRALDHALITGTRATDLEFCPSCRKHNGEDVSMGVLEAIGGGGQTLRTRLECPICHTQVSITTVEFLPPPKRRR